MIEIKEMEELAKNEEDGCWNEKVDDHWLEVEYMLDGNFRYRWGKNIINRELAINILSNR